MALRGLGKFRFVAAKRKSCCVGVAEIGAIEIGVIVRSQTGRPSHTAPIETARLMDAVDHCARGGQQAVMLPLPTLACWPSYGLPTRNSGRGADGETQPAHEFSGSLNFNFKRVRA